jgi:transcription elongation factor SPT6
VEIFEVFGTGEDYEFALAGDDEPEDEEEQLKPEMKYQDVRHLHIS